VHVCNPGTWEAEAGGSLLQPGLHSETLSQNPKILIKSCLKKKKEGEEVEPTEICNGLFRWGEEGGTRPEVTWAQVAGKAFIFCHLSPVFCLHCTPQILW
jgi:hypothetical protein